MTTTEKVLQIVEQESGIAPLTLESRLDALDMDSLEFVEMMVRIAADLADIPDAEWAKLETVGDIVRSLEIKMAATQ